MDTAELLKKVRKIEIKTKGLSKHIFSGEYHSAFKGRGMSFSEVRDYHYGDDVRNIDWNVTARTGDPHIKIFEEERELTVMLCIDVSQSSFFGTIDRFKSDLITELSAVLSFSAIQNNDKVGVILFSDRIEKFIPPKKGKTHILKIIRELINYEPTHQGTNLSAALEYLNNVIKKRCIAFILSDFITEDYGDALRILAKRHDVVGICIYDPKEEKLPSIGLMRLYDPELNQTRLVDTSNSKVRKSYQERFAAYRNKFKNQFVRSGADPLFIRMDQPYVKVLMKFFKKRAQ